MMEWKSTNLSLSIGSISYHEFSIPYKRIDKCLINRIPVGCRFRCGDVKSACWL